MLGKIGLVLIGTFHLHIALCVVSTEIGGNSVVMCVFFLRPCG